MIDLTASLIGHAEVGEERHVCGCAAGGSQAAFSAEQGLAVIGQIGIYFCGQSFIENHDVGEDDQLIIGKITLVIDCVYLTSTGILSVL